MVRQGGPRGAWLGRRGRQGRGLRVEQRALTRGGAEVGVHGAFGPLEVRIVFGLLGDDGGGVEARLLLGGPGGGGGGLDGEGGD